MANNDSGNDERPRLELPALPPVIFSVPVLVGVLVHVWLWGGGIFGGVLGVVIGVVLVLVGLGLIAWSFVTMRAHGEHPEPGHPTKTLVVSGPFKRTRNPIYVGFLLIAAGLAVAVNALAVLVAAFVGAVALTVLVIRREEAYLTLVFGDAYIEYIGRTRRWI
jgi:protein-S-isoprenylcysteine O-methyltransferase Ste14